MAQKAIHQIKVKVSPDDKSDKPVEAKVAPICEVVCNTFIDKVVKEYNARLKPSVPLEADWLRALLLSETEAGTPARKYDPMQIANDGDFALSVLSKGDEFTYLISTPSLREALGQKKPTPRKNKQWDYASLSDADRISAALSIEGGVAWLFHQAAKKSYKQRTIESGQILDYEVKQKDTLEKIAKEQETTDETLVKYSGLKSKNDPLSIGQKLKYRKAKREWYIAGWGNWEDAAAAYNANPKVDYRGKNQKNYKLIKESDCPCRKPVGRVFFSIYYKVADNAFKRAADTWELETKKSASFNDKLDQFISVEVTTEAEFKAAWKKVHTSATSKDAVVVTGQIFSHASKTGDGEENGLEFKKEAKEDGTLHNLEIASLEKLNWDPNGAHLILSGCNSGLRGERKWAPADTFARTQNVMTTGQAGYAYFSQKPDTYVEITSSTTTLYLWAYQRKRNGWFGDGERMPGVVFKKPKP